MILILKDQRKFHGRQSLLDSTEQDSGHWQEGRISKALVIA